MVLVRTRSISQPWASFASAAVSPMGEGLLMVTAGDWDVGTLVDWEVGWDAWWVEDTCAASGKRALNNSAPTIIPTCSLRFPLTNLLHFNSKHK